MSLEHAYKMQLLAAITGVALGFSVWLIGGLHLSIAVGLAAVLGAFFATVTGMIYEDRPTL